MSITLIVGDLHLGKGISIGKPAIGNMLNSRIADQLALLDWVFDQAQTNHAGAIIFTGDICQSVKPDYILIELFVDFLKRCESSNIDVHIIAGNHDLKRTGTNHASYLDLLTAMDLPTVHIYKNVDTIFRDGVGFTLLPFRDKNSLGCATNQEAIEKIAGQLPYEVESIPSDYQRVLIGHLALAGSIFVGDEFDNLSRELMCPPDIFVGYDYVWMGHVHKPQVRYKKPHIAHIGSLDISDFGETDHQKIIVVFDTSLPEKYKEIIVPSRPLRRVRIDVPEGFDPTTYIVNQINAMHKKTPFNNAIVRVEAKLLDPEAEPINRPIVEKAVYLMGGFYVCSISESRNVAVEISQEQMIESTIAVKAAINVYANNAEELDSDDEREQFIDLAVAFADELAAKEQK